MCEQPQVNWHVGPPHNNLELLASYGRWQAVLAKDEIYSDGQIFVVQDKENDVHEKPAFFGQCADHFPDGQQAMQLIQEVSHRMVAGLRCGRFCGCGCQNVYVVSLNEGDWDRVQRQEPPRGLHFWLLPRYEHDRLFLNCLGASDENNDGLALMAHWREQFLARKRSQQWDCAPLPKVINEAAWTHYAMRVRRMLAHP